MFCFYAKDNVRGKDRDYKPEFNPKFREVLEKMNAEKRASLENEGKEIKEIEGVQNSANEIEPNTEQTIEREVKLETHKPMKKAANDDYDMGM
nr:hypothetical protein [Helicobacter acinonychis]